MIAEATRRMDGETLEVDLSETAGAGDALVASGVGQDGHGTAKIDAVVGGEGRPSGVIGDKVSARYKVRWGGIWQWDLPNNDPHGGEGGRKPKKPTRS